MRRCRPLLGTFVEVGCDRAQAIDAAFAEIARIHRLMSAHDPDSELSRINRFAHLEPVRVSEETAVVLRSALRWYAHSAGAFDPVRAGALAVERGGLALHPGQPMPEAVDFGVLHLDRNCVRLDRPACIDLGGIAKGHAVDLAVAALKQEGASGGLVNAGGDLRAFGGTAERIIIVEPESRRPQVEIELENAALATSAGLPSDHGLSFAHLTGHQAGWASVTVRAPTAMTADVLTKIVWALGHEAGRLLREAGAKAFAVSARGCIEEIGDRALAA